VRRLLPTTLLTLTLVLLVAVPAFAHASFDIKQVASSTTESYSLRVPLEREAGNTTIAVLVPAGWTVVSCDAADGWSCLWDAEADAATTVSMTRQDDEMGATERFAMELTAPAEAGVYSFPVVQEYDDGTEAAWIEEPGEDHPAPRIQVGDSDAPIERDETLPEHTGTDTDTAATPPNPDPTPDGASQPPSPAEVPTTTTAPVAETPVDADDDPGRVLPYVLAGGVTLAVGAGLLLRRRGRS
jgi:uncharacterized protein YcnI